MLRAVAEGEGVAATGLTLPSPRDCDAAERDGPTGAGDAAGWHAASTNNPAASSLAPVRSGSMVRSVPQHESWPVTIGMPIE